MYLNPMGRFGRMKMSHLIANTEGELHAMARQIGIARRWYQGDHYDISISKRQQAILLGAVPVTMFELAGIRWCIKNRRNFNSPDHALLRMRRGFAEQAAKRGRG